MEKIDRYKGALLGLAVGDALGTTLEFERPGKFAPIDDMVGGGPFQLKAGQWTDDTSMALCLAQSLIEKKGFNTFDQMEKYYLWMTRGYMSSEPGVCVDIGVTTRQALLFFDQSGQPICGRTERETAGNGSLMRLAPVPMYYGNDIELAVIKSGISSKTTHAAPQAIDACKYFALMLINAFEGISKTELLADLSGHQAFSEQPLDHEISEVVRGSYKTKNPPEIISSGYVVKTLEAALWAFYHTETFEEGAIKAVNLGNDADTVGAVYGQIAGAYYGMDGIPQKWLEKVYMRLEIEKMAEELYQLSNN